MTNGKAPYPGRSSVAAGAMAAIACGFIASTAPHAEAQPFACSASLNVSASYCRDTNPPCDPTFMVDGMQVELIVAAKNDSSFNTVSQVDPPAGNLGAGKTMKIYYSCSAGTCSVGEELPNWFTFQSATTLAGASFADDGNGYSGTLTIDNDSIAWAAGDTSAKDLVKIQLVVAQPPAPLTGLVFARAGQPGAPDDSDNILEITEADCIGQPIPGGGEGTTAGILGHIDVFPFATYCTHPNPTILKFRSPQDYLYSRLAGSLAGPCDPSADAFSYTLSNAGGVVGTWNLAAGQIQKSGGGRRYIYQDKGAKKFGGIRKVLFDVRSDRVCMNFKGYEDLSTASDEMAISFSVCGNTYSLPPVGYVPWKPRKKGFVLPISQIPSP